MPETKRLPPTKGNLLATEKALELATMGFDLMDKKRSILVRELMALLDRAQALRDQIDSTYTTAYEALQSANISVGTIEQMVQSFPVEQGLSLSFRSVMGIELATVSYQAGSPQPLYALSQSNPAFDEAYCSFYQVKLMLTELAELENNIFRLTTAIKQTQSRANALKNVIIPQHTQTIKSISNALDEAEREEFTRLKVIKK